MVESSGKSAASIHQGRHNGRLSSRAQYERLKKALPGAVIVTVMR